MGKALSGKLSCPCDRSCYEWNNFDDLLFASVDKEDLSEWGKLLSTCPAKNQAGCIERVVHHSHENQKFYLFKIAINEKCQKLKLTVKAITVAMATAV